MRRSAVTLGLVLLIVLGAWPAQAPAEDAPPPGPPLERLFAPVRERMAPLPPFLGDAEPKVHFRTYSLAFGGWLSPPKAGLDVLNATRPGRPTG